MVMHEAFGCKCRLRLGNQQYTKPFGNSLSHFYGEAMSRSISAQGAPTSGDVIQLPFPDIQKPESGDWTLTVRLKSEDDSCGEALVEFLQQDEVIQSTTVTLTNSFADYDLEIPQPDLEKIARGRCSMTELYVRVRCTAIHVCGCEDPIPSSLTVTLLLDDVPSGSFQIMGSGDGQNGSWAGSGMMDGQNVTIQVDAALQDETCFWGMTVTCLSGSWFARVDSPFYCNPFEANFLMGTDVCFGTSAVVKFLVTA